MICRLNWGEERAYYRDEKDDLVCIPARWTSVIPPDPVVELSGGHSWFRVADLLALFKLVDALDIEEQRA